MLLHGFLFGELKAGVIAKINHTKAGAMLRKESAQNQWRVVEYKMKSRSFKKKPTKSRS